MKQYDYLLFDWDGCLAQTLQVWFDAYKTVFARYGVTATNHQIAQHFGDWESPKYFGITDVAACTAQISAKANRQLLQVSLYSGAFQLLMACKRTKKLALLTSSKKDMLLQGLAHNNLTDCFEVVLTADDVDRHKPDPEIIHRALTMLGAPKDAAIMIGDSSKDILAAQAAGVDCVLMFPVEHHSYYDFRQLAAMQPTYIVQSFSDLRQLLTIQ